MGVPNTLALLNIEDAWHLERLAWAVYDSALLIGPWPELSGTHAWCTVSAGLQHHIYRGCENAAHCLPQTLGSWDHGEQVEALHHMGGLSRQRRTSWPRRRSRSGSCQCSQMPASEEQPRAMPPHTPLRCPHGATLHPCATVRCYCSAVMPNDVSTMPKVASAVNIPSMPIPATLARGCPGLARSDWGIGRWFSNSAYTGLPHKVARGQQQWILSRGRAWMFRGKPRAAGRILPRHRQSGGDPGNSWPHLVNYTLVAVGHPGHLWWWSALVRVRCAIDVLGGGLGPLAGQAPPCSLAVEPQGTGARHLPTHPDHWTVHDAGQSARGSRQFPMVWGLLLCLAESGGGRMWPALAVTKGEGAGDCGFSQSESILGGSQHRTCRLLH